MKVWHWIAWHLPGQLIYWCITRALIYATSGPWSSQQIGAVTGLDIMERWRKGHALDGRV